MRVLERNPDLDEILLDLAVVESASTARILGSEVKRYADRHLRSTYSYVEIEYALAALATAAEPEARAYAAQLTEPHLPSVWARDILCGLVVDPDDVVCLQAIEVAGRTGIEEVAHYLLKVIGSPSQAAHRSVSPVGRGAAVAYRALLRILEVDDPEQVDLLADRERRLGENLPLRGLLEGPPNGYLEGAAERWLLDNAMPEGSSMVLVPGGTYNFGLDEHQVPDHSFAWQRSCPSRRVWLPPFLIDKRPVAVAEYDAWSTSELAGGHDSCHPLEPSAKIHRRNTRLDPRVGPDHPVTGIDWYDATAFARAQQKELPTEYQWEVAARGPDGTIWPWGDAWDPSALQWFGGVFDCSTGQPTLREWREQLARANESGRTFPAITTAPVNRQNAAPNPFGLSDMVGNCWEWTRSALETAGPYSPTIARYLPATVSVVLKGGTWSSLKGQLYPSFRGQDAPFCRHDEIGFRCVRQIPFAVLREMVSAPEARFGRQHY